MRVYQILCVGLALTLSSCASWHKPGLVYRGRNAQRSSIATVDHDRSVLTADDDETVYDDEERANDPQVFDLDAPTLTPPIESVSHRTGYRGQPERARPVRKERVPSNPPGLGYIELPPPPDLP